MVTGLRCLKLATRITLVARNVNLLHVLFGRCNRLSGTQLLIYRQFCKFVACFINIRVGVRAMYTVAFWELVW